MAKAKSSKQKGSGKAAGSATQAGAPDPLASLRAKIDDVDARIHGLLNERAHLSPDMAIRIEKAFGVSMETLMRMQNSYDIAQARKREAEIKVERYTGMTMKGRA